ncbi:hypothetical protein AAVH_28982 [Aphelenchoides avenae]|nr:hypothetical protein AAVH_28982 [Aphelenchus avenae]
MVVNAQPGERAILWSEYAIAIPEAVYDQLNATLRASGKTDDSLFVDCSLNPGPLSLTFGDPGVTYNIPFSQLITNVDGVCELNIAVSFDSFYIGLPFLREYCVPSSIITIN